MTIRLVRSALIDLVREHGDKVPVNVQVFCTDGRLFSGRFLEIKQNANALVIEGRVPKLILFIEMNQITAISAAKAEEAET